MALRFLAVAGAAASVLYAAAGAVLFLGRRVADVRIGQVRAWALLWMVSLVPIALVESMIGHFGSAALWLVQAAFGVAAGWALVDTPTSVRRGLSIGLAVVSTVLLVTQLGASGLWHRGPTDNAALNLVRSWFGGHEVLIRPTQRSWSVPAEASRASFKAEVKSLTTGGAWTWDSSDAVTVTPLGEGPSGAAVIRFGETGDPYAQRWFDLGSAAGGKRFRVSLELRSDTAIAPEGCRGIWLQTWGEGGEKKCMATAVDRQWRPYQLEWKVPSTSLAHIIRVVLNNFDGYELDVRNVRLLQHTDDGWSPVGPLAPTGDRITLLWTEAGTTTERSFMVPANTTWHPASLTIEAPAHAPRAQSASGTVSAAVVPSTGSRLAIRAARVTVDGVSARPRTPILRQGLWFGHPNLSGHAISAAALATLALASRPAETLALFVVGIVAVFLTGSRTALLALVGGGLLLSLIRHPTARRWLIPTSGVVGLVAVAMVAASLSPRISQPAWLTFNDGQETTRTAIWGAAASAWRAHPLVGLAGAQQDFSGYWRTSPENSTGEVVRHAHNFWLQFASRYGLAGAFAALWITMGLLVLGWRSGRWAGTVLVGSVLFMNVADYTLLSIGVLVPLVLGLNTLRADPVGPAEAAP